MKISVVIVLASILFISANNSFAQCAMCTLNAENSVKEGNTQGKGLNSGILYLLAAPYIAVAGIGFIWYKKYGRKNGTTSIKTKNIHLN